MPNPQAASEWRAHWPVVLATTVGFSLSTLVPMSLGLFMEPLGREFGWGRSLIAGGPTIAALELVLISPFIGALIDRWGSRRLALPSIVLTAGSLMCMASANGSPAQWLIMWAAYGLLTFGIKPTIWTAAITHAFWKGRGLALGITVCGTALSEILAPPVARYLIDAYGWREAYVWLGLLWATPTLVLAALFLRDPRSSGAKPAATVPAAPGADAGLGCREALRSPALLRLGAATLIMMCAGTAALVHQVPILVEAGVTRTNAAWLASLAGLAGILGKLVTGWLMDRPVGGVAAPLTIAMPAIGFTTLMAPAISPGLIVGAMVMIGYSAGAKMQIAADLTGRYGGRRNFGKIFGVMTSLIGLGGALGPVAAGAAFDAFHTYQPLLAFGAIGSLVAALLIFRLGPYPDWDQSPERTASEASGQAQLEPSPSVVTQAAPAP